MKKVTDFIVKYRNIFLACFIVLALFSLYLSKKVNINEDIMKYLPKSSETKIGNDIMEKEFPEYDTSNLNVMFKGLSKKEKKETLQNLENIKGVSKVDYNESKEYNKGKYTLYKLNVNDYAKSRTSKKVYDTVNKYFDVEAMSGSIYDEYKPILQIYIVILAISCAMIILIILSESYIEPFLYLISIGIAVFINKGTNIMFSSVSSVTNSIVAILQLALSMDYSIMLSNRFKQEKEKNKNKSLAMKEALYHSFKAISSSSLTTMVGLLALVFMSFTIGRDLGFVLAKGVLLSLISIFCCLPALLLIFDNAITKTKKRSPKFNLTKLGIFSYKTRFGQLFVIIGLFIAAFLLKGNINILYTGHEQDEVGRVFPANNQIAIVYENKYESLISKYCKNLEEDKKIDSVLCYSNTIGEKLKYNELNDKFKSLGQDVNIDEDLIKVVYYNYYNPDNENKKMTIDEFINFININLTKNKKFKNKVSEETKSNLELLTNFTNINKINKKRSADEIAGLLEINQSDVEKIIVLYNSKNVKTKLKISTLVNFILNDVKDDNNYSSYLDKSTIGSLNKIKLFTNESFINKRLSSKELSSAFNIDEENVKKIILLYQTNQKSSSKLTVNEFATFALSLSSNKDYKSMFSDNIKNELNLLKYISDKNNVENKLNISNAKSVFNNLSINISDDLLEKLYIFYNGKNKDIKLNLKTFVNTAINLKDNDAYKSYFSDEMVASLNQMKNLIDYKDTELSNEVLYQMFNISDDNKIKINNAIADEFQMTPVDFVQMLISNEVFSSELNQNEITSLNKALYIMSNSDLLYKSSELAEVLKINKNAVYLIYGVSLYQSNNLDDISLKELINFIYDNKDNDLIKSSISNISEMINLSYKIMNNLDQKYLFNELSNLINKDVKLIQKIYGVYDYLNSDIKISPFELTETILKNLDNSLVSEKLNTESINNLKLVYMVMKSVMNNEKYSYTDLAKTLNVDKDKLALIYSLYDYKKVKDNNKISLNNLVNFLINNVINDKDYASKFSSDSKEKLIIIENIISSSLKKEEFSSSEIFEKLSSLSKNLDKSLIDLVYIYYGSSNNYDESWELTIEEFVNYLNDNVVKDDKYSSFISDDKKNTIKFAAALIYKSKNLIVSKKYSRMVLNTKYDFENKESYKFIEKLNKDLGSKKGVYVVGNTPMAVEMSKSFNFELNRITILTMIFIFLVVAFTFKDLLIPLILVLIIQTAVYITMSVITLTGGNVYFISLIIVQAILMGATIDYAIVYTSYYKESRNSLSVKESIINAYNKSIHTIINSSSILIIVTLVVSNFASAIAAKICETVSQGTFVSTCLILLILPGTLAATDKLIIRNKKKKN